MRTPLVLRMGGVALAIMTSSAVASADITKSQCVDANTTGQNLRRDGKLALARTQYQLCNDPKCPDIVRSDCTQRLDELEAAFPTMVFDVKKGDGSDIAEVKITVDGNLVAEKNDGAQIHIDPGSHEVKFEVAGEKEIVRTFVLKEGEKARRERIVFGEATPAPLPVKPVDKPAQTTSNNGDLMRYGGLGAAAVGVVVTGVGVVFGLRASAAWSDQQKDCASVGSCANHARALTDHSDAQSFGTVSTIGVLVGGVFILGGAALFLLAPKGDSTSAARMTNPLRFSF